MSGNGSGLVFNKDELKEIASQGLAQSLIHQIHIEESLDGWMEFDVEIMRDSKNKLLVWALIENIDPLGIHSGDSVSVFPAQTLDKKNKEYLVNTACSIADASRIIGCMHVRLACNPENGEIVVIDMNPRFTRTASLASKATGFPAAQISSHLSVGMTLTELSQKNGNTLENYQTHQDQIVVKIFYTFPDIH